MEFLAVNERNSIKKWKYRKLLIVYGIFVILITICRKPQAITNSKLYWDYIERNIQLIPLSSIQDLGRVIFDDTFSVNARVLSAINIIGNIFIMVPFGLFLPNVSEKMNRLRYFLLFTIGGILLIEMLQLFGTIGTFDIDDIILNVIGALLGFKYTAGQRNVQ